MQSDDEVAYGPEHSSEGVAGTVTEPAHNVAVFDELQKHVSDLREEVGVVPCVCVAAVVVLQFELAVLLDIELLFDFLSLSASFVCDSRTAAAARFQSAGVRPSLKVTM